MEQSIENKSELKTKIFNFYKSNKVKIFILLLIIITALISFTFIKYKNEKNNIKVAEKYVEAGINLSTDQKDKARKLYEEIIYSENKFYSILALNTILEKNLVTNKNEILKYFEILEKSISLESQKDLIVLKKALYLIKEKDIQKGNNLLKELINNKSSLDTIAQEILNK